MQLVFVVQAVLSDCLFLDLFPFSQNGFVASEVDVGGCDVAQALVVTLIVVRIDEGFDLTYEIAGQVIVFQQNPVLHGLVPALDLTLSLRVERCSANVIHSLPFLPLSQIARDVVRAVIAEQPPCAGLLSRRVS